MNVLDHLENCRREAQQMFLTDQSVVGVGISASQESQGGLLFLLRQRSPESEQRILRWAQSRRVNVDFVETGPNLPA